MPCAKFGWDLPSGSGEKMKSLGQRQRQQQQQQRQRQQQRIRRTTDEFGQKSSLEPSALVS